MAGEQSNYPNYNPDLGFRLRDLEEKQRILKNQLLLIGKNLIEIRERNMREILEVKKETEMIKGNMERLSSFLETVSEDFQKFARKDDVDILAKQMRMFQPFGK
ncbi:MAG: hypothetical protein PHH00_03735 [Candidatus Nanoarchaeia archaeon]|nr:hypothetical protein [Candidatus Nanoarchaeia archaeon]